MEYGNIQIYNYRNIVATCDTLKEAVEIAKENKLENCSFMYACEVAYLDDGQLMIQDELLDDLSVVTNEIKDATAES